MKILTPIGSKKRFLEMYQGVNKLNEESMGALSPLDAALDALINDKLNIEQVNNQVSGDESIVEISGTGGELNVTFKFKVHSSPTDQDGVNSVDGADLIYVKINDNEVDENSLASTNANRQEDLVDAISEYVEFESTGADDEMFEDAARFIDNVPYNKGSEEIQTQKAYADQKPTNPALRVKSPELDKFVSEKDNYVPDEEPGIEMDPTAMPPEFGNASLPNAADDGSVGVDPYDTFDDVDVAPELAPEQAAIINQAYEKLVQSGNPSPTMEDTAREANRMEGIEVQAAPKTRTIPRGAEEFYEAAGDSVVDDMDAGVIKGNVIRNLSPEKKAELIKKAKAVVEQQLAGQPRPQEMEFYIMVAEAASDIFNKVATLANESTDQDKFEDVVFMQGEEADEPLEILRNQGEDAAMEYLMQWHDSGNHMGSAELAHGSSDQTYEKDGYTMAWNTPLNYIGLQYNLSGLDEEIEKTGEQFDLSKHVNQSHPNKGSLFVNGKGYPFYVQNQSMPGVGSSEKTPLYQFSNNPELSNKFSDIEDAYNFIINNPSMDEDEENYPKQMGKKFKPKNQMPKKKKKQQSVVKLAEIDDEPNMDMMKDAPEDVEQVMQDKEEAGDELEGGLADDKSAFDFCPKQIAKGIEVEMEHTENPLIAIEIVMDHLVEDEFYYGQDDEDPEAAAMSGAQADAEGTEDDEMTDELLGFEPHNVGDYANVNEINSSYVVVSDGTSAYVEDMNNVPEDANVLEKFNNIDDAQEFADSENAKISGINEEEYEEYQGNTGDRYADAEGNEFSVRDKTKGGVTLKGQGGEKEVATSSLSLMKNLGEAVKPKEVISEAKLKLARQALSKRGLTEGMTKKEAVQLLIKNNIR